MYVITCWSAGSESDCCLISSWHVDENVSFRQTFDSSVRFFVDIVEASLVSLIDRWSKMHLIPSQGVSRGSLRIFVTLSKTVAGCHKSFATFTCIAVGWEQRCFADERCVSYHTTFSSFLCNGSRSNIPAFSAQDCCQFSTVKLIDGTCVLISRSKRSVVG